MSEVVWKLIIKLVWFINNYLSARIGHFLFFSFCIDRCYDCGCSGYQVGYENNIYNCSYCSGRGYLEKSERIKKEEAKT